MSEEPVPEQPDPNKPKSMEDWVAQKVVNKRPKTIPELIKQMRKMFPQIALKGKLKEMIISKKLYMHKEKGHLVIRDREDEEPAAKRSRIMMKGKAQLLGGSSNVKGYGKGKKT